MQMPEDLICLKTVIILFKVKSRSPSDVLCQPRYFHIRILHMLFYYVLIFCVFLGTSWEMASFWCHYKHQKTPSKSWRHVLDLLPQHQRSVCLSVCTLLLLAGSRRRVRGDGGEDERRPRGPGSSTAFWGSQTPSGTLSAPAVLAGPV